MISRDRYARGGWGEFAKRMHDTQHADDDTTLRR